MSGLDSEMSTYVFGDAKQPKHDQIHCGYCTKYLFSHFTIQFTCVYNSTQEIKDADYGL